MTEQIQCPACNAEFTPRRKNQKYCSDNCRKRKSRHAARGSRKVAHSWDERRRSEMRKTRLTDLTNALYEAPPRYRAEFLERLIAQARSNAELRRWLTRRDLLKTWYMDGTGRIGIGHSLDHYCQEVYGQRSYEVLNPENILPTHDALAFPAEYFGPDHPPIYEDGCLKRRPCPWSAWKVSRKYAALMQRRRSMQAEAIAA